MTQGHQGGAEGSCGEQTLAVNYHINKKRPRKIVTVVRKRASILGWSVIAPDTILPPVLKNPIREIRRADSSSVRPLC